MAMAAAVVALLCAGVSESALCNISIGADRPTLLAEGSPTSSPRLSSEHRVDDDHHAPCEFLTVAGGEREWWAVVEWHSERMRTYNTSYLYVGSAAAPQTSWRGHYHWQWTCMIIVGVPAANAESRFGAMESDHDCFGGIGDDQFVCASLQDAQGLCAVSAGCVGVKGPYFHPAARSPAGLFLVPPAYWLCYSFYPTNSAAGDLPPFAPAIYAPESIYRHGPAPRITVLLDPPAKTSSAYEYSHRYASTWQWLMRDYFQFSASALVKILFELILSIVVRGVVERIIHGIWIFQVRIFNVTNEHYHATVMPMVLMTAPYRLTVLVWGYVAWYIALAGVLTVPIWTVVAIKLAHRFFAYPSWTFYIRFASILVTYGSTWSRVLQCLLAWHRHQSVVIAAMAAHAASALVIAAHTQPPPRRRLRRADLAEMPRRVLFA